MAEFVEVMKQKKRMCNKTLCCKCDIFRLCGEDIGNCSQFILSNPSKAEKIIMSWAAEHPEPVYPTWEQVIAEIYLQSGRNKYHSIAEWERNEHIPADIAKKLGIEPKEGT